jgi:glycosyltransferase involved in cell wall biosynthesis
VRLVVLSSAIEPEGVKSLSVAQFIDVMPDPGNDLLPSYLKGADILLLAEGFDEGFVSAIKLSISSKAHLFMFSHRPIIVYAHADTGIARYAQALGWAKIVTKRSKQELVNAILQLAKNKKEAEKLVGKADEVVTKFHSHQANREILYEGLSSFKADSEENE